MIDLYAFFIPNAAKIFIALEEMSLPYNTRVLDLITWELPSI